MTTQTTEEHEFISPANIPDPTPNVVSRERKKKSLWTGGIIGGALRDSFIKLNPRTLMKNPVMFVVEIGSVITTFDLVRDRMLASQPDSDSSCRSRCGSGSRCSSRISPKPWPKAAAKRRPTRCAKLARKPLPGA